MFNRVDLHRQNSGFLSPVRSNIPLPQLDDSPIKSPLKKSPFKIASYLEESPSRRPFLPTLPLNGSIPRITNTTLVDVLSSVYDDYFDELYIVDCRYPYEYEGGHIRGAMNSNSPEDLYDAFFTDPIPNALVVFHCEFSHNRGPQIAGIFRDYDRKANSATYPNLYYPNVYILDGGYQKFYENFTQYCDGGYTRMLDDEHRNNGDLVRATTEFRRNVEKSENSTRMILLQNKVSHDYMKSPVSGNRAFESPMTSKMMKFMSSPMAPRRI